MKFLFSSFALFLLSFPLSIAQTSFQSLYQSEASIEVFSEKAANGDILLVADSYNDTAAFFHRIWVQRLDEQGTILQTTGLFRPPSFRLIGGIQPVSDNGLLLLGTVNIPLEDPDSVFVIKLAETGLIEWSKGFQVESKFHNPRGAIETSDGNYLVYGTYEHLNFAEGIFLVKMDPSGNLLWSRIINSQLNGAFMKVGGIVETANGDFWLSGSTRFNSEGSWLAKLNNEGETQSVTFFDTHSLTPSQPEPFAMHQRSNGELDIFYNSTAFQSGPILLAIHTDANGQALKTTRFSVGNAFGEITDITPSGDGGYLGAGYRFAANSFRSSAIVMKINGNYQLDWAKRHGTDYIEIFTSVFPRSGGGYVASGFADFDSVIISPSENGLLPWLLQTDENGNIPCYQQNTTITTQDTSFSTMSYQLSNVPGITLGDIPFANIPIMTLADSVACLPTGVETLAADFFRLYPNPSQGKVFVEINDSRIESIELFGLFGRKLEASVFQQAQQVEIQTSYQGLAIIRIQSEQGNWSQKVLFQGN